MPARPRKTATVKPDFDSLLDGARLVERTVPVCLRGDLVGDHEIAERELQVLLETPVTKLSGDGRGPLQQRIRDLEAEMRGATYEFRLRALSRNAWHAFVAEYPPRPGSDQDAAIGINNETFFEPLIKVSTVDPDMGIDVDAYLKALVAAKANGSPSPVLPDGRWPELFEKLTDRQFDSLADPAFGLNRRDVDVPFSPAAWRQNGTSEPE